MQPRVGSSQNIYKGGVANGTQINDYSFGVQNVEGEGVSNQTHIGLTGTQNIKENGEANYTSISRGGEQNVNGGEANHTVINIIPNNYNWDDYAHANQNVNEGGVANFTELSGYQNIWYQNDGGWPGVHLIMLVKMSILVV